MATIIPFRKPGEVGQLPTARKPEPSGLEFRMPTTEEAARQKHILPAETIRRQQEAMESLTGAGKVRIPFALEKTLSVPLPDPFKMVVANAAARLPELFVSIPTNAVNFFRKNINAIAQGQNVFERALSGTPDVQTEQFKTILGFDPRRVGLSHEPMVDTMTALARQHDYETQNNPPNGSAAKILRNALAAVSKTVLPDVLDALFAVDITRGVARQVVGAAKYSARQLPDSLLFKIQERNVSPNAIFDVLQQGEARLSSAAEFGVAKKFIQTLPAVERAELFKLAKAYERTGLNIPIKVAPEQTTLGRFAEAKPPVAPLPPRVSGLLPGRVRPFGEAGFAEIGSLGDELVNLAKTAKDVATFKAALTNEQKALLVARGLTAEAVFQEARPSAIPKTADEFNRLSLERQGDMFDQLPAALQNKILGADEFGFIGGAPLQETAEKIAAGKMPVRVPKDTISEFKSAVGKGNFARLSRTDRSISSLDEVASDLGVTESELVEAVQESLTRRAEAKTQTLRAKAATREAIRVQKTRETATAREVVIEIAAEKGQKGLSGNIISRLKEKHGIREMKNAPLNRLHSLLDDMRELQVGDEFLSRSQVNALRKFGVDNTTTKREAVRILGDVENWPKRNSRFFDFFKTIEQKIERTAGKDAEKVKNVLTRPRAESVAAMIKEEITLKSEMRDTLSRLKVKDRGSRALIMRYGEKRISLDELKQATQKWKEVMEADAWFREKYDDLIESTNTVLRKFYPEDKLIPKRKDYYTHSQELGSVWNEFTKGGDINPALEQISEFTRPNRKFNPWALQRKGGAFVEDAAVAFEAYLPPVLNNKNITEHIIRHRAVADILAHNTLEAKNVNQFIFSLRDAADSLAGKTNPFDRALMNRVLSRPILRLIQNAQVRLSKNRILGSIGSALMQISGIPNSVLRNNIVRTARGLLTQAVSPLLGVKDPIRKSNFMVRRYGEKGLQPGERIFSPTALGQALKTGANIVAIPFEVIEKNVTSGIWRASYDNAYSQGFRGAELVQQADEITASIVGSRALGEKALAFESGVLSLPLQFQLEVNTHAQLWQEEVFSKVFKDPIKAFRAAVETAITLFLLNSFFQETLGRTPLPDPIRAIDEASDRETFMEVVGRIAGEGLSSVAGGQFIASLLPEDVKKKYFGRSEVGIYPGGIPVVQAVSKDVGDLIKGRPGNFVYDFVLPYGGGQLKKIVEGVATVYKMGSVNQSGKLQFPVNQNEWLKIITFGKYSTKEAREYFDKQRQPLSMNQTVEYFSRTQNGEDPVVVYSDITRQRRENEYRREFVEKLVHKTKSNPKEGLMIIQLWKKEGIIDAKMEQEILDKLQDTP